VLNGFAVVAGVVSKWWDCDSKRLLERLVPQIDALRRWHLNHIQSTHLASSQNERDELVGGILTANLGVLTLVLCIVYIHSDTNHPLKLDVIAILRIKLVVIIHQLRRGYEM